MALYDVLLPVFRQLAKTGNRKISAEGENSFWDATG
jgi:hypothetical protein